MKAYKRKRKVGLSDSERFWSKVEIRGPNECWPFRGNIRGGYGRVRFKGGKKRTATHIAWELTNGPIPERLEIMHTCDNPPCCNPAHLKAETHVANMQDMLAKGRRKLPGGAAHHAAVISNEQAELVREMAKTTKNKREIARALGIAYHVVFNILKRGGYSAASSLAASTETVSFSPSSKLT